MHICQMTPNKDEGRNMEPSRMTTRRYELVSRLSSLPKRIVSIHDADHLADLVFCELCGKNCFDLRRAAYFLDNPDFDCCRGIIGFNASEVALSAAEIWENPMPVSNQVRRSPFYQKVRTMQHASVTKNNSDYLLAEIAKELDIEKPQICICKARNDNHGVLIMDQPVDTEVYEFLEHGISLLSLCPLF